MVVSTPRTRSFKADRVLRLSFLIFGSAEGGEDAAGGDGDEVVGDAIGEVVAEEDLVDADIGEGADTAHALRGGTDEAEFLHGLVGNVLRGLGHRLVVVQ